MPCVPGSLVGDGHQDRRVADGAVGDEVLRAVQDPLRSPSRTAVVFVPFESLPASDSVSPQAPIAFP